MTRGKGRADTLGIIESEARVGSKENSRGGGEKQKADNAHALLPGS